MNSASHSRRKSLQFLATGFFSTTIPKLGAASDGHETINAWAEIEADIDMVKDLIEPLWSSNELPSTIRGIEESLALKSSTISNTELERLHQQMERDRDNDKVERLSQQQVELEGRIDTPLEMLMDRRIPQ